MHVLNVVMGLQENAEAGPSTRSNDFKAFFCFCYFATFFGSGSSIDRHKLFQLYIYIDR